MKMGESNSRKAGGSIFSSSAKSSRWFSRPGILCSGQLAANFLSGVILISVLLTMYTSKNESHHKERSYLVTLSLSKCRLFSLYLVPMVLLSDCRFVQSGFVQSGPLEYECSQETHIAPVCPILRHNLCRHRLVPSNTGGLCSMEKPVNEQFVADGAHEVAPNTEQEGQSDFR
jgi:hypothetical protein